ncbi:uncharacterized protein LOC114523276 [Dendronephthya gigantea]|uniref:uncharacterized protein LOC114523276 n=1 Tax=Dendronephthya gigantea TaxID=151771 RepID=UPI00106C44AE|nr:uncharacterized protein LOC114523276 [Dendronephthya gigantea]XP_028399953.1 uncharacterized protein LOC114523276 [Dendronephthya gigantea]
MAELTESINAEFNAIEQEWPNVRDQTKSKISTMKDYYSARNPATEVAEKTDRDYKDLKDDLDRHRDLASRGLNAQRELKTQVNSSANRVQKLIKFGKPSALAFPVLGAVIGAALGAKAPGWGQVAAIVVGGVVGFILFAVVALVLYFGAKLFFVRRRNQWEEVERLNKKGMESVSLIEKKKSCLSEIRNLLDGIEEDNMPTEINASVDKMAKYLEQP